MESTKCGHRPSGALPDKIVTMRVGESGEVRPVSAWILLSWGIRYFSLNTRVDSAMKDVLLLPVSIRSLVRMCRLTVGPLSLALLVACSGSETTDPDQSLSTDTTGGTTSGTTGGTADGTTDGLTVTPPEVTAVAASYRLTFNAIWSPSTHPLNFPGNPHFSGLVGAVHNEQVIFWEPGQIASPGIEFMAETGGKSPLLDEVQFAVDAGSALAAIDGPGIGLSPDSVSIEFDVTVDYPQVTITSMLAPSPDWFVGLHNFSLLDVNGEFIESAVITLPLYDSGTDNGASYESFNDDADPKAPIARVFSEPADSPFVDGEPNVGTFTLELISSQ